MRRLLLYLKTTLQRPLLLIQTLVFSRPLGQCPHTVQRAAALWPLDVPGSLSLRIFKSQLHLQPLIFTLFHSRVRGCPHTVQQAAALWPLHAPGSLRRLLLPVLAHQRSDFFLFSTRHFSCPSVPPKANALFLLAPGCPPSPICSCLFLSLCLLSPTPCFLSLLCAPTQSTVQQHFDYMDRERRGYLLYPELATFLKKIIPSMPGGDKRTIVSYLYSLDQVGDE